MGGSRVVRVLVVDRAPLLRRGVAAVLADQPGLQVVGETDDGDRAVTLVESASPDVVLLDLDVRAGGGAACARIRATRPSTAVVVLAESEDHADLPDAVRAGARGYLLRDTAPQELVEAVRTVAGGQSLLSPAMASRLLEEFAGLMRRSEALEGQGALSRRELEVLGLVAEGLNNRTIAERLYISESTVKNHMRSIHDKLQVHSRTQAVAQATRQGLLTPLS